MKTLSQLIRNTQSISSTDDVVGRSRRVSVGQLSVRASKQRGVNTLVFTARCQAHTERVYYDVQIELFPTEVKQGVFKLPSPDNNAWVSCECAYYQFHCEYALAKVGSAEIYWIEKRWNDSDTHAKDRYYKPKVLNRRNVPYLCKHLYAAAPLVVKACQEMVKRKKVANTEFTP